MRRENGPLHQSSGREGELMSDTYVQRHLLMLEALRLEMRNLSVAMINAARVQSGYKADLESQSLIAEAADNAAKRALND